MGLVATTSLRDHMDLAAIPDNAESNLDTAEAVLADYLGFGVPEGSEAANGPLAEVTGLTSHVCVTHRTQRLLMPAEHLAPITTLESVAGEGGTELDGEPWDADDFHVSPWSLLLSDVTRWFTYGQRVLVTYTTGWANEAALPTAIAQSVLVLGAMLQSGRDGVKGERLGDYSYTLAGDPLGLDPERSLPTSLRIALRGWRRQP